MSTNDKKQETLPISDGIRIESSTNGVSGSNTTVSHYYCTIPTGEKSNVYLGLGTSKSFDYNPAENTSFQSSVPAVDIRFNQTIFKGKISDLQVYERGRFTNFTDKENASAQIRGALNYNIKLNPSGNWKANVGGHVSTVFQHDYNIIDNSNAGLWGSFSYIDKKTGVSCTLEEQVNFAKKGFSPYTNFIVKIPIGK